MIGKAGQRRFGDGRGGFRCKGTEKAMRWVEMERRESVHRK